MPIDPSFLDLMPSTVMIYPRTATSAYGKPTYSGTGVSTRCRVEEAHTVNRGGDGRDVVEGGTIYCYGCPAVTVDAKVVLPDGTNVKVLAVETFNDDVGPHHTVIRYGP